MPDVVNKRLGIKSINAASAAASAQYWNVFNEIRGSLSPHYEKIKDVLVATFSYFQQMITKLCFNRALHFTHRRAEHDGIKFLHHLSAAKFT